MQKKKFNFKNIQGMLSRDEMKQIRGGGSGRCNLVGTNCYGSTCTCDIQCPGQPAMCEIPCTWHEAHGGW